MVFKIRHCLLLLKMETWSRNNRKYWKSRQWGFSLLDSGKGQTIRWILPCVCRCERMWRQPLRWNRVPRLTKSFCSKWSKYCSQWRIWPGPVAEMKTISWVSIQVASLQAWIERMPALTYTGITHGKALQSTDSEKIQTIILYYVWKNSFFFFNFLVFILNEWCSICFRPAQEWVRDCKSVQLIAIIVINWILMCSSNCMIVGHLKTVRSTSCSLLLHQLSLVSGTRHGHKNWW